MELANPNPYWESTGAIKLSPDWRDFQLANHPSVAPMLSVSPESFSLREFHTGETLQQNGKGACVCASSSHMQALYEQMERRRWIVFDWDTLYTENGGTGNNGVRSRDVLQDMQDRGCPVLGSGQRYKIQSYAFVDFSDFDFAIQTVKAAVAAKRPLVLALLLPSDFSKGKGSGASSSQVTSGYHQVMVGAYELDEIGILNSWGSGFGDNGWGSIKIDFLRRPEQRGFLYAFTTFDAADTDVDPVPTPDPPDPTAPPILVRAKYKAVQNKLVLTGFNFAEGALVTVDGNRITAVWHDSGWMTGKRLSLAPGIHVASIRNLARGASSTKEFTT